MTHQGLVTSIHPVNASLAGELRYIEVENWQQDSTG